MYAPYVSKEIPQEIQNGEIDRAEGDIEAEFAPELRPRHVGVFESPELLTDEVNDEVETRRDEEGEVEPFHPQHQEQERKEEAISDPAHYANHGISSRTP